MAQTAGVQIATDGRDLLLEAHRAPPAWLLERLVRCKAEIIAQLQSQERRWSAAEWQAYYDERAAIREHDGRLFRAEAERLALEDTVTQWLCLHPAPATSPDRGCIRCGVKDELANPLLAVLTVGGSVWVHDRCLEPWRADRRHQAMEGLRQLGLCNSGQP
jgi:hypothetical protein